LWVYEYWRDTAGDIEEPKARHIALMLGADRPLDMVREA
jgi:hypothetical protein